MGFKVEIGGFTHELKGFSVEEASTPLSVGDSTGQVGTINLDIAPPDTSLETRDNYPAIYGPQMMIGREVTLTDTRKGFTLGHVVSVSSGSPAGWSLTCETRLGFLNIYDVQAQPFVGSLEDAFAYYLSLAGITTELFVDPAVATRPVVFPGWHGELWFNLKQMSAALDCDISLVSGVILLRPIRVRVATRGRDISRSMEVSGSTAQSVEVYRYDNRPITDQLVYPPGGWSEEVTVINVNAGETVEQEIELSASVSSIQQPVMQTFVSKGHSSSSVFTVVGDDGFPITPSAWNARGGSLRIDINPDTTSLTVHVTAPTGLPNANGEEIGVYGIALSADESTGRYSTLRIVGSGVSFDKQLHTFQTGLTLQEAGTEVGTTVDNPFISSLNQVYSAGTRVARQYKGRSMTISGSVIAVNQLGDSGAAQYPSYGFVQALHAGKTYAQVQTEYAGQTYGQIRQGLFDLVRDQFENQVFGNVSGARVWDKLTRRWYRVRAATLSPGPISFTGAEDDLTHGDVDAHFSGNTYGDVQALWAGLSYDQANLTGLV